MQIPRATVLWEMLMRRLRFSSKHYNTQNLTVYSQSTTSYKQIVNVPSVNTAKCWILTWGSHFWKRDDLGNRLGENCWVHAISVLHLLVADSALWLRGVFIKLWSFSERRRWKAVMIVAMVSHMRNESSTLSWCLVHCNKAEPTVRARCDLNWKFFTARRMSCLEHISNCDNLVLQIIPVGGCGGSISGFRRYDLRIKANCASYWVKDPLPMLSSLEKLWYSN